MNMKPAQVELTASNVSRRTLLRAGLGLGSGLLLAGCAVKGGREDGDAEAGTGTKFPERSVEWVVPFAAGGSTDLIAACWPRHSKTRSASRWSS
jgi:hypothetical protein